MTFDPYVLTTQLPWKRVQQLRRSKNKCPVIKCRLNSDQREAKDVSYEIT